VRVIDTRGAYFASLVAQAKAAGGPNSTICDVDVPAEAK